MIISGITIKKKTLDQLLRGKILLDAPKSYLSPTVTVINILIRMDGLVTSTKLTVMVINIRPTINVLSFIHTFYL